MVKRGGDVHQRSNKVDSKNGKPLIAVATSDRTNGSKSKDSDSHDKCEVMSLRGDYLNIALLLFLYILQGIPLGLGGSIPLILQNRKVSYAQQAIFSFVNWPFSVKLLWAPIVDAIYSSRFGRRKSWLVPTQYLIGLFMLVLSYYVNELLGITGLVASDLKNAGNGSLPVIEPVVGHQPNIYLLTGIFLALNFLAATQDIAVDGWALTMLQRRNVSYASTCNTVGQTAGYFLGNVVFLALESKDFCNKFLRSVPQETGIVGLSGFLYFWGIVFFVTTTLVMIMKSECQPRHEDKQDSEMSVYDTYLMLLRILKLPAVQTFVAILLTCKIGFAATDAVTGLKLMENGVNKEHLAMLAIPMVPLQIILPWVISKYTNGPRPLDTFLKAYPFRLMFGIVFAGLLAWTKVVRDPVTGALPFYYFVVITLFYALHQVSLYMIFVALMAFHAAKSDPAIGGTYMTLLNTLTNLGGNWPATLALWAVESLDIKSCTTQDDKVECTTTLDGYYVETCICIALGFLWLRWGRNKINRLQSLPLSAWKCS